MKRVLLWLPLAAFLAIFALVAAGLWRPADRTVRSALVGKTLPAFTLPPLVPGKPGVEGGGGRARLVNVFASWCVPCIAEAPQLMRLKAIGVPIDAVAVRDTAPDVTAFLTRNGDPYARIGDDRASSVQLSIGSSGVPETFVVDSKGVIVEQHVGEIREDDVARLAALVRDAP
jgi:cytochrome c biogenesis protein CcmG/thiol:disulfide interchange protein DsbE